MEGRYAATEPFASATNDREGPVGPAEIVTVAFPAAKNFPFGNTVPTVNRVATALLGSSVTRVEAESVTEATAA